MAFGECFSIKANGHMGWFLIIYQVEEGIRKSELGIGISAGGGCARIAYQGVVGSENEGKGIQQV
jgi:hypothetical protein